MLTNILVYFRITGQKQFELLMNKLKIANLYLVKDRNSYKTSKLDKQKQCAQLYMLLKIPVKLVDSIFSPQGTHNTTFMNEFY
jgi:hypothetical protein